MHVYLYFTFELVVIVQVQVKQISCPRDVVGASCVCGVAMRENETILIADVCGNDTANPYYTYNAKYLPKDAGIKVSDGGRKFKVSNQIKSNGLLGIAALMLDHNNIEVCVYN